MNGGLGAAPRGKSKSATVADLTCEEAENRGTGETFPFSTGTTGTTGTF